MSHKHQRHVGYMRRADDVVLVERQIIRQLVAQAPIEVLDIRLSHRLPGSMWAVSCTDRADPALHGLGDELLRADVGLHMALPSLRRRSLVSC
jgi:hypothetical protein